MTALKILQCVDGDTDTSKGGSFTIPQHPENDVIFMLQSVIQDTIEISWEVNSSYQAQFTAWDDGTEAFQLLECQNMVEIAGQWFVIKQLEPDYSGGITTVQVTLSHVSNEISRLRLYDSNTPVDWGNYKHTGASSTSTTVPSSDDNSPDDSNTSDDSSNSDDTGSLTDSTDSTDSSTVVKNVTPQDILDYVFKGNSYGITYEVIGDFAPKDIDSPYASGSWKDIVDRITQNWTDAVIMPDNLDFKVYSHDSFYQDHGNRVDYLHDTSEIQLQYDDTNMLNGARLVGATYEQQTTTDTGLPNGAITGGKGAQAVINDARKYLGVPYVYGGAGGARGGNPFSGMDCSSYVSQVYKDFGINIPAQQWNHHSTGYQPHRQGMLVFMAHLVLQLTFVCFWMQIRLFLNRNQVRYVRKNQPVGIILVGLRGMTKWQQSLVAVLVLAIVLMQLVPVPLSYIILLHSGFKMMIALTAGDFSLAMIFLVIPSKIKMI